MVIGRFFGVSTHILGERAPAAITIVAKYIDILIPTTMLRKNLIEDVDNCPITWSTTGTGKHVL